MIAIFATLFLLPQIHLSKCQLLIIGGTENLDNLIEVYQDNSPQIALDFPMEIGINKAIGGTYFDGSFHFICGGIRADSELAKQCYKWENVGGSGQWNAAGTYNTVFENHRKSLIQHCARSELRLHLKINQKCQKWSILARF